MKKLLSSILTITILFTMAFSLVGCNPKTESGTQKNNTEQNSASASKQPEADTPKAKQIGIVQIVEHPSLNTIRESIIKELEAKGFKDGEKIKIDYQSAQGDMSNLATICQNFVSGKYDLIIAIATPSAQQAVSQTTDIPIVFSACTDPLSAGIVKNLEKPGGNVTGTSDAVSAEKIIELAKKMTPGIKTIGALYNLGEPNSVSVINDLKEYAKNQGISIIEATVTSTADVQQAVNSFVDKVDAIFSPIDNTVATAMPTVAEIAIEAKIPVYVGADSMVKAGGLATYGINYEILGKETGIMAADILNGRKPGDIPVMTMTEMDIYINSDTAEALGITIPDDVLSKAKILKK